MASSLTMESTMANVDNDEGFLQKDDYFADEMMGIVSDLVAKCSTLSLVEGKRMGDIEKRLDVLQDKIVAWDYDPFMIWDCDPEEASEYLNVVNEVRQFSESLESLRSEIMGDEYNELVHRAHSILQMAMARLEKEFVHLLVLYQQTLEPDHMSSFRSTEDYSMGDLSSCRSFEVHPIVGRMQSESSIEMDEFVIDLIHPSAVSDLKCVAEMMLKSNYDKECCKAYISIRKEALYKSFSVLCMERSSTDILQMDSGLFNSMIKRWNQAIKVFIRVCLTNERSLCDLILGGYSPLARNSCFVEITKDVNLKMLNFYGAVSTGSPKPEKLFRMLDMFEGLYNLIPEIDSSVVSECQGVLSRLGEFIRLILTEFKNAIRSYTPTNAFAGGGYHPFTKYAMNYIKTIADYSETLGLLLDDQDDDDLSEESKAILSSVQKSTPVIQYLLSITSMIESNLEGKSILYRDAALQHIFLMNNIFYMVQKVKNSELQKFLGEEWIKEHSKKYRQHAISYQRASWNPVLLFLRDEGIWDQGLYSPSRTIIKDRFKKFNLVFEEVYKSQTAWVIPSVWLRVDLRISVSIVVLQAYRTFVGRYSFHLDNVRQKNKYIKYSLVDLEEFLLDLFEGFPKSLHSLGRKNN